MRKTLRIFASLTALMVSAAALADITPVQSIDIEVSESRTYSLTVMQGETYEWRFRYLQDGVPIDLSSASLVRMGWQARGVSYAIDGALYLGGTTGVARVTWAATNATPPATYQYVSAVMDGDIALARSRGSLTVLRGLVDPTGDAPLWSGVTQGDLDNTLTNLIEGAGIEITGTGRTRTITATGEIEEIDPIWAAVSNAVTQGAAAGATATQPGDDVSSLANDAGYLAEVPAYDSAHVNLDHWTWTTNSSEITLTGYSGPNAVVIPDWIDGYPVVGFGTVFNEDANITSVSGGANVTSIGDDAFFYCSALANVSLPSATSIGSYAFGDCIAITSVSLPSAASIGNSAFLFCTALTSVFFDADAPTEGINIYEGTPNVTNYVINPVATGWGATFGDRPVVRLDVFADNLGTMAAEAAADYVKTNDTRAIDWTGADIRIADATKADSPTTLKDVLDIVQDFATDILYGSTNAHPTIAGAVSMWDAPPETEQAHAVLINANDTDFDAGVWYYTNKVSFVRPGKYFGRFFATRSGGVGVTAKMRLVYTNVVTGASGTIDESAAEPIIDTALRSYRLNVSVVDSISSDGDDIYLGVGMTFRKTGNPDSTVTIYTGDPYDTHLETPGLGKPEGFVTQAELDAADQALRDEIYPAITNAITAASITPTPVTNDVIYLSSGAWQSLDSGGAGVTNSLSIDPGLAASIDFVRLDVRWDGVSTIEWPTTNLVTYIDDFILSSNVTSVVVFDSALWQTNWTGHLFPKEAE